MRALSLKDADLRLAPTLVSLVASVSATISRAPVPMQKSCVDVRPLLVKLFGEKRAGHCRALTLGPRCHP
eukprot:4517432-Pyramimonas_sp.AAC.1